MGSYGPSPLARHRCPRDDITSRRAGEDDLGLRLGWVRRDEAEEQSFTKVIDRLSHEGESILLIYDSAIDANTLKPYLPRGGRPM